MSKHLIFACAILFAMTASMAKSKSDASNEVIQIKQGGAVIYRAELSGDSDKVGDATSGASVQLFKEGRARSLIKVGAIRGWVDNSALERIENTSSARNLKDIEVQGWLDNPSAVYILDNSNPDIGTLPLDRSFSSEIVDKKDRESVERTYDENN
jgi:hypothetical protein